jgi:hypothetical protein
MSSYVTYWISHVDGVQQNSIQDVPYSDMAIEGACNKLVRVVRIQDGGRYSIRVGSSISSRR